MGVLLAALAAAVGGGAEPPPVDEAALERDYFQPDIDAYIAESGRLRPSRAACANSGRRGTGRRNREMQTAGTPSGNRGVTLG